MPWEAPGSTAIIVVASQAGPVTGGWYEVYSKAGSEGMPPHVTLLVPFVPVDLFDAGVDERLRSVFARFRPLEYALTRLRRWLGTILYLSPEPARPFVELTEALVDAFPGYLPYEGAHEEILPHATVAVSDDEALLARIEADVQPHLPIACRAVEATLVERGRDLRWRPRTVYRLGSLE
jgi:hypothetical protein